MKFSWSSIGGGALSFIGFLARPDVLNVLPTKVAGIVMLIGAGISMFSGHAVQKTS